eukprot:6174803-Pleurochrysis_carterae.AAC.1
MAPDARRQAGSFACARADKPRGAASPTHRRPALRADSQGAFETMQPAIPQTVPFWLGMYLKKRGQCRIQIPPWLEIGGLRCTCQALPHATSRVRCIGRGCAADSLPDFTP